MSRSEERTARVVIFDLMLAGFYRWSKRRPELLGFKPIITPYRHDKYEKMYTAMMKEIHDLVHSAEKH